MRISQELCSAAGTAEKITFTVVVSLMLGRCGDNCHSTYRVFCRGGCPMVRAAVLIGHKQFSGKNNLETVYP